MVLNVVFVIVFAGGDELESADGSGGGEEANFAGGVAVGYKKEIGAAAGAFDVDAEAFVEFFIEQGVGFRGRVAEGMAVETVGALGDGVFDHVEDMAVVGGPGGAGYAFGAEGEEFAGAQVFDLERVLAEAGGVSGVGEKMIIVGDFEYS